MADSTSLRFLLPRQVRELPADLAFVLALVAATNAAVFAPLLPETPLRIPLGLALVLFLPGYALAAAVFPEASDRARSEDGADQTDESGIVSSDSDGTFVFDRSGITGLERVAISVGLSVVIVPLIGVTLDFTPLRIGLAPTVIAISAFVVASTVVAAARRRNLPAEERFSVPYRDWARSGRTELLEPDTRAEAALNVLLVASVLLALGTAGYALAVPPEGEQFSEVSLLTEGPDGELIADDYPTEFEDGERHEAVFGIENHERRTVDYTTVFAIQRVETADGDPVVIEQERLDRFDVRLEDGESHREFHEIEPTMTGDDLRLVWLVYQDGVVPDEPSLDNAAYSVHLEIDVED